MKVQAQIKNKCNVVWVSIVDPDPVGSETFSKIRIRKKILRDPDPNSSGSGMNFKQNYFEKLAKCDYLSTKMLNSKI